MAIEASSLDSDGDSEPEEGELPIIGEQFSSQWCSPWSHDDKMPACHCAVVSNHVA